MTFLPPKGPTFLGRIVKTRGNGYAIVISTVHFLALTGPNDFSVQSFNSRGQDPCEVAAYMLSTCFSESFAYLFCFSSASLNRRFDVIVTSLLQLHRSTSWRYLREDTTLSAALVTRANAVPSDIRS